MDSPELGTIGPSTYNRQEGHRENGFLMATGLDIKAGTELSEGRAVDICATILDLMEAKLPDYFDGQPIPLRQPTSKHI